MTTMTAQSKWSGAGLKVCAVLLATAAASATAAAQGIILERNISTQFARSIADAAMECTKDGVGLSVAVVDRAGQVRIMLRGNDAPPFGLELARRKAVTARAFRRPSLEWAKRTETGALVGQRMLADVIPLGGGMPIKVGEETLGAVGVSGVPGGMEADEKCAKAALAKVADQLK
jgi:uncharacterized protein GlcG (DUF336 family)